MKSAIKHFDSLGRHRDSFDKPNATLLASQVDADADADARLVQPLANESGLGILDFVPEVSNGAGTYQCVLVQLSTELSLY